MSDCNVQKKTTLYFILEKKTFHDIDHPIRIPEGAYLKCGYYKFIDE